MLKCVSLNKYMAMVVLILIAFSVSGDLYFEAWPRKAFYTAFYLSVVGLLLSFFRERYRVVWSTDKYIYYFIGAILLLGLSKFLWSASFDTALFSDIKNNYRNGGKILILSAVVSSYLLIALPAITVRGWKIISLLMLLLGVVTLWAGYQEIKDAVFVARTKLLADAATTTGYIFVLQSVACLSSVRIAFERKTTRTMILALACAIFGTSILLTGTRGALGTFIVLTFALAILELRAVRVRYWILTFILLLLCSGGVAYKMKERIIEAGTDFQALNAGDASTSVGARVAMLDAGISVFDTTLLGQSVDERFNKADAYIKQRYQQNDEAILSIHYHFHNEMVESLSLQGLLGIVSLLMFYISGLIAAAKGQDRIRFGLFATVFSLLLMGLTDVIFIQSNTAMVIGACVVIAVATLKAERSTKVA